MSNYIKYYRLKSSKSKKATHRGYFIDARGKYPKRLGHSKDYYYVIFGNAINECDDKEMRMEDFDEFIKDYIEVKAK